MNAPDLPVRQYVAVPAVNNTHRFLVVAVHDGTPERVKKGKRPRRNSPFKYTAITSHDRKGEAVKHANVLNVLNDLPLFEPR